MKSYNVNTIDTQQMDVNGKGDDKLWNRAVVLSDFSSPWDTHTPDKIEFRTLWNLENLYFLFKVYDNSIYVDKNKDEITSINNSDRVELFFKKDDMLNPYYCLEIDPLSRLMDFRAEPVKKFDFIWNWPKNDILIKSDIRNEFFTVEGAISLASLKRHDLINNGKIQAGIYRAKYHKQKDTYSPSWITWVNPNTETPNFHTSASFGELNLLND